MCFKSLVFLFSIFFAWNCNCFAAPSAPNPASGPGYLVFFNSQYEEERFLSGLEGVSLCANAPENGIYIVGTDANKVVQIQNDGKPIGQIQINEQILSLRSNADGQILVATPTKITSYERSGEILRSIPIKNVVEADFLGKRLVVIFDGEKNFIRIIDWNKTIISQRSPHDYQGNNNGKAKFRSLAVTPKGFISVWDGKSRLGLDSNLNVLPNIVEPEIRKNSPLEIRATTRSHFGPSGARLLLSNRSPEYALIDEKGNKQIFTSDLNPTCGVYLSNGGYVVGFSKHHEKTNPWGKARHHQLFKDKPTFTLTSLAGISCITLIFSFLLSRILRLYALKWRPSEPCRHSYNAIDDNPDAFSRSASPISSKCSLIYVPLLLLIGIASAVRTYQEIQLLVIGTSHSSYLRVALFGAIVALVLQRFTKEIGVRDQYFHLKNCGTDKDNRIVWPVLALSLALCIGWISNRYFSGEGKCVVALWIASQIFFLSSFIHHNYISKKLKGSLALLAVATLTIAVAVRFWKLGDYPHGIHHDHGLFGHSVLTFLYGDWQPFFAPDKLTHTYMRPWVALTAALFYLFDINHAILRLSNAIWGVALVFGCYLLGSALATRRLGIVFAMLVSIQHSLIIYTRQPYVVESTAPFVFSVYCAVNALRFGRWASWAWAGAWAGYAMLSIRQCTTFPLIWSCLLLGFFLFSPKSLWKNRIGILLLLIGGAIVYLPFTNSDALSGSTVIMERLRIGSPLIENDFSITKDTDIWKYQFGRSFGSLFLYPDNTAWGIGTRGPIFGEIAATCFIIGLGVMFVTRSIPLILTGLVPMLLSISLGSALLWTPPTYYHMFVGIVFALLPVAVLIEKFWSMGSAADGKLSRISSHAVAFSLICCFFFENIQELYGSLKLPETVKNEHRPWAHNINSVIARHVLEHRDAKFFIVRRPSSLFSASYADFFFYGFHSDIVDLNYNLDEYLPLSPIDEAAAVFYVLPERQASKQKLLKTYPTGVWTKLFYGALPLAVDVLTVQSHEIDKQHDMSRPASRSRFTERFNVNRSSVSP